MVTGEFNAGYNPVQTSIPPRRSQNKGWPPNNSVDVWLFFPFGKCSYNLQLYVETFQLMINEGISELLFTSDGVNKMEASYYPELLGGKKKNKACQMSCCLILKKQCDLI